MALKNYHLLKAIFASLKSPALYRLKSSWARLDPPRLEIWNQVDELCSNTSLFKTTQERASRLGKEHPSTYPSVPFLSPILGAIERTKAHSKMQQQKEQNENENENENNENVTMSLHLSTMIDKTSAFLSPYIFLEANPPAYRFPIHTGIQQTFESYLGTGCGYVFDDPHSILSRLLRFHSRQLEPVSLTSTAEPRPSLSTAVTIEVLKRLGDQNQMTPVQTGCSAIQCYVETIMSRIMLGGNGGEYGLSNGMGGAGTSGNETYETLTTALNHFHNQINELMLCGERTGDLTSSLIKILFQTCGHVVEHLMHFNDVLFLIFLPKRLRKRKKSTTGATATSGTSGTSGGDSTDDGTADMFKSSPKGLGGNSSSRSAIDVATLLHETILKIISPLISSRLFECLICECRSTCAAAAALGSSRTPHKDSSMVLKLGWSPLEFSTCSDAEVNLDLNLDLFLRRKLIRRSIPKHLLHFYEDNLLHPKQF